MLIRTRSGPSRIVERESVARIAILGLKLESNAFAPVTGRPEFIERGLLEGQAVLDHPVGIESLGPLAVRGFGGRMRKLRQWEPVPIVIAHGGAGGPCDHEFFEWFVEAVRRRIREAGRIDGVYIDAHGAGITTKLDDLDGAYFHAVRDLVGPGVPIVATLDLHGNISGEMVRCADVQVSLVTNPHIDEFERAEEAAEIMDALLLGMNPVVAFERLPLVTPQVTQLTRPEMPYGDLLAFAKTKRDSEVLNISILSGFAFTDTVHNGMAILVTTRSDVEKAESLARELAARAWNDRARYQPKLTSVDKAVALALAAGENPDSPQIVLADVADNPGGGARGNTTWLLERLVAAGAKGVQFGVFYDPPLVQEAVQNGIGSRFDALFNRAEASPFSMQFRHEVEVVSLFEGRFYGTQGSAANFQIDLGPSCLLRIDGIHIVVISIRRQLLSVEYFEKFGLTPAAARTFVVKSRGHFRASFEEFISPSHIYEVDAPGLVTPNLGSVPWHHLHRPCYPLDPETAWP